MFVEFRMAREYGVGLSNISIKNLKAGSVVQKVKVVGDEVEYCQTYGHIVSFAKSEGKLMIDVKWDFSSLPMLEYPENLVFL